MLFPIFMKMNDQSLKTKTISVEAWHDLIQSGLDIPVVIPLHGSSMYPLVRYMRDQVTVRKCCRRILLGDIVLFQRADGQYVIHRVWKTADGKVLTMGDNCTHPDFWMPESEVLGLVTHVRRGTRFFCVDTPLWRFWGRIWLNTVRPRTALRKILSPIKRVILSIFRRWILHE